MIELKPADSGGYRVYYEGQVLGDVLFQNYRHYFWPAGPYLSGYLLDVLASRLKEMDAEMHASKLGPSAERTGSEYVPFQPPPFNELPQLPPF